MPGLPVAGAIPLSPDSSPSTDTATATSGQFTLVQAMRGVAAMWVALFHINGGGHIPHLTAALPEPVTSAVFRAGHFGVAIFFALSGFVIAYSLRNAAPTWGMFGRFAARRSLRLDPAYWAAIALTVGLGWLSWRVTGKDWSPPGAGSVIAHVFYLQELLRIPEINIIFWTLTFEIQFYVFFVVTLVLTAKAVTPARREAAAWTIGFVLALGATAGLFDGLNPGLFLKLWNCFFVGALAYFASTRPIARPAFYLLVAAMLIRSGVSGDAFAAISASTAVLFFWSLRADFAATALNWRWLQFLGAISYSLYLTHNPISAMAGFLARRVGLQGGVAMDAAALAFICLLFVGVAAVFWWLIERPSHRLSRRLFAEPRA